MSNLTSASGEASFSSGNRVDCNTPVQKLAINTIADTEQPSRVKRKRNLPGNPDPDAEVIALSPKALMTTNRFLCEICNKGFQRDQNLQLHRRGHNLPWKLRQRSSKEIRKRVYICPEPACVHHDPSRALGDLTGIKKHYCRKHGEKKWKCDKCSKKYAVQSDWKAHSKTCGTREYRCDCGTLFSRRDSFITHRAFCDALAEESARASVGGGQLLSSTNSLAAGSPMSAFSSSSSHLMRDLSHTFRATMCPPPLGVSDESVLQRSRVPQWLGSNPMDVVSSTLLSPKSMQGMPPPSKQYDDSEGHKALSGLLLPLTSSNMGSLYSSLFTPGSSQVAAMNSPLEPQQQSRIPSGFCEGLQSEIISNNGNDSRSLPSLYGHYNSNSSSNNSHAQMSATALLQKAAQMGAKASHLGGFCPDSNSVPLGLSWQAREQEHEERGDQISSFVHSFKDPMDLKAFSDENAISSQNTALQDVMNSLSTGGFGSLDGQKSFNSIQQLSAFGESGMGSSTEAYSGFMTMSKNNSIGLESSLGSNPLGLRNLNPRAEEGDGLTRDFLGVGGSRPMVHPTVMLRPLLNMTPLGSYNNHLQSLREDE